ncbi:endonuclease/exonuclease/phosphatase family protein [Portibacter marinus]|uniref:endonuclease/exonuclease/phosphatase family protein n=1 Tax=Portibacter marinus TaxID=2898660 RepID=UPI001F258289|nr:endonuclease/exonuclease/phosphatase family protein [Portibacter marinus]
MSLKLFLKIFGFIAIALTLIPIFGANYWWIRMFDFPHLQLTLLTLVAILVYLIRFDHSDGFDLFFPIVLFACFSYQVSKIFPYTELAKKDISDTEMPQPENDIKLYTANVLQTNESYQLVIDQIKAYDPDVVLLTETNWKWQKEINDAIFDQYAYNKQMPLNNFYGMLMYSKFEMLDPEVKFLVSDSIPSIHTKLKMPSGDTIQFYAIHPTPPMPQHNPTSTDRDAEMMKIALKAMDSKYPVIVMGDFNDVAWSNTTQLFEQVSGLLDLRKGRGLYNTFDAENILLRWPLDHIFISEEFRLIKMDRGGKIDSDHFPVFTHVNLEPKNAEEQKADPASAEQIQRARDMAARVEN